MNSFIICINAVLPIFLLMALGYLAQRCHLITKATVLKMNKVVFAVFLPIMILNNLYVSDFASSVRPGLMAYTAAAILVVYAVSTLLVSVFVSERSKQGVMVQGLFRSNYMMIGLALAANFLDASGMGCVSVLMVVVIPIYNILAVITLASHNGEKISWGRTLLDIVKNPLIIGTVLGMVFVGLGIKLPTPLESVISQIGQAATPLVLFLLGAFFRFSSLPSYARDLFWVCLGRLVVVPGLALAGGIALGFGNVELVTLVAIFGSATATASFPMAQQMGGDAELAGNIVVATSALCSFTLFGWCFMLMSMGLI